MRSKQAATVQILLESRKDQLEIVQTAAALARELKTRLEASFIEEESLINAAELTISREISLWSAQENQISAEYICRSLRANARYKRKQLEKAAQQAVIESSFNVCRGERLSWILQSVKNTDVLFTGGTKQAPSSHRSLDYSHRSKLPIHLYFTGSNASKRALKIAIQLAQVGSGQLIVSVLENDGLERIAENKAKLEQLLTESPAVSASIEVIKYSQLKAGLQKPQNRLIVFPYDMQSKRDIADFLNNLLSKALNPIILVR